MVVTEWSLNNSVAEVFRGKTALLYRDRLYTYAKGISIYTAEDKNPKDYSPHWDKRKGNNGTVFSNSFVA